MIGHAGGLPVEETVLPLLSGVGALLAYLGPGGRLRRWLKSCCYTTRWG